MCLVVHRLGAWRLTWPLVTIFWLTGCLELGKGARTIERVAHRGSW